MLLNIDRMIYLKKVHRSNRTAIFHISYIYIVAIDTIILKQIIKFTYISTETKFRVLVIVAIPIVMTISIHGIMLAIDEPGMLLIMSN